MTALVAVSVVLGVTGCTSSGPAPASSPNVVTWKAGNAVVVLVADLRPGTEPDVANLGRRPGVIAAWTKGDTLRVSFGRSAMLADMAALKLELEHTAGVTGIRETIVAPS